MAYRSIFDEPLFNNIRDTVAQFGRGAEEQATKASSLSQPIEGAKTGFGKLVGALTQGGGAKSIAQSILDPGTTFLTPKLKSNNVPFAGAIGLAADIVAPGPGEINKAGQVGAKKAPQVFKGFTDLSTKLVERLKGKAVTSKQEILDLSNMPSLKQAERDVIRNVVNDFPDKISVKDFANKVKAELLPLRVQDNATTLSDGGGSMPRYENISLPSETRGPVADYKERIYRSPVKTSAGDTHFSGHEVDDYFAHTRIEDIPSNTKGFNELPKGLKVLASRGGIADKTGDTRRVIELQSDLFQKGRLETEAKGILEKGAEVQYRGRTMLVIDEWADEGQVQLLNPETGREEFARRSAVRGLKDAKVKTDIARLEPYRNTWHERIIREEVKQAAIDGKTKLQFPTGETAMKIEGLGQGYDRGWWNIVKPAKEGSGFKWDQVAEVEKGATNLKVGDIVINRGDESSGWVVTDVLGDGKFKAVQKRVYEEFKKLKPGVNRNNFEETFDISGKIDANDPIYRFYEKEVGKYLRNRYGAQKVTDAQGVTWWELPVTPEQKRVPVEAFGALPFIPQMTQQREDRREIFPEPLFK